MLRRFATASVLLWAAAALGADETAPVPKPDVKVGDRWRYRVQTHQTNVPITTYLDTRASFVSPDAILNVESASDGHEGESQFGSDWSVHSIGSLGQVFDPPIRYLNFPLQVGAEHPYVNGLAAQRGSPARTRAEGVVKVLGWEEVSVPAGRLRALKVEAKGSFQRLDTSFRGWQRTVIWYSPEVKRWVKYTFEVGGRGPSNLDLVRDIELVDFKVQ
jgi:hypothetical protein